MRRIASLICLAATLGVASVAHGATTFEISGGGNGHGIGMSQYGAYGYALHGKSFQFILGHYYRGTGLGRTNPHQVVQVLLATGRPRFSGASTAAGHKLDPTLTYSVRVLAGGALGLVNAAGKKVAQFPSPLTVRGPHPLDLAGQGEYRGALQFSVVGGAVQTVDAVALDDYVRGVIAAEMPASWPLAALEAQAVAARTYAISSNVGGNGYQLYPDTRSQMYGGVAAETTATDEAVAATRGGIVTYHGAPATTYFFASSGGHTENVENVFLGTAPRPWLKGVADPYDGAGSDPYHRWSERMTLAAATKRLGSLVHGRLRGIKVTKRGVSPRVVDAQVVGTAGSTAVNGPQLQSAFGLMSTYMRFTTISAVRTHRPGLPRAAFERVKSPSWTSGLRGDVFPASRGAVIEVQLWSHKRWHVVRHVKAGPAGSFAVQLSRAGRYRVVFAGAAGPAITVR